MGRTWIAALVVLAAIELVLYSSALSGHWIDSGRDMRDILPELRTATVRTVAGWLTGPWVGHMLFDYYRPVSSIAMLAEYRLFGESAANWQLVSLCLHVGSSVMLVLLIRGLFNSPLGALAGGAVWAFRDRMALAIEWTPAQTDMFAAFFAIFSLLCLHKAMSTGRWGFAAVSGVAELLAMASKEVALVLPALATLVIIYDRQQPKQAKALLLVFFWLLLGAFLIWRFHALSGFGYVPMQAKLGAPGRHFHVATYYTNWLLFILPQALGPKASINALAVWTAGIVLLVCVRIARSGSGKWMILAVAGIIAINFMLISWIEWLVASTYWSILEGVLCMGLLWLMFAVRKRDILMSLTWGALAWIPIAHPVYNPAGNVTYLPQTYWALLWACVVAAMVSLAERITMRAASCAEAEVPLVSQSSPS